MGVIYGDEKACAAVCIMWSPAEKFSHLDTSKFRLMGNLYSNNGISKLIRSLYKHPQVRYVVLTGLELGGTLVGDALVNLFANGVEDTGKIIGSKAVIEKEIPVSKVRLAIKEVKLIDMRKKDKDVNKLIKDLEWKPAFYESTEFPEVTPFYKTDNLPALKWVMDPGGYFVIRIEEQIIFVDHYANEGPVLRIFEGKDAKEIYKRIVVSGIKLLPDHWAYLGAELTRAQIAIKQSVDYIQDAA